MPATPGVTIPLVSQGGREALLTDVGLVGIPVTIDLGTRVAAALTGPRLYARCTASPYKAKPFMLMANITTPTNSVNATVDVPDADAIKFQVGDTCTFWDVSTGALDANTPAGKVISAIGATGSGGGGAGFTLITFTGVWTTAAPASGDKLCVLDGSHLAANAIVILEDIPYDGSKAFNTTGYIAGVFDISKVTGVGTGVPVAAGAEYFDMSKCPNLQFVTAQP